MNKIKYMAIIAAGIICITTAANTVNSQPATVSSGKSNVVQTKIYNPAGALDVVANPYKYLHKNIKINAKFDKFSTLGLDYPPVKRSSEQYISFLIQRPDVTTHDLPLSELKIFLKKEIAEKNIDLDSGDEIEFTGHVFSVALGDAWMDVDDFKVIKKKKTKTEEKTIE